MTTCNITCPAHYAPPSSTESAAPTPACDAHCGSLTRLFASWDCHLSLLHTVHHNQHKSFDLYGTANAYWKHAPRPRRVLSLGVTAHVPPAPARAALPPTVTHETHHLSTWSLDGLKLLGWTHHTFGATLATAPRTSAGTRLLPCPVASKAATASASHAIDSPSPSLKALPALPR